MGEGKETDTYETDDRTCDGCVVCGIGVHCARVRQVFAQVSLRLEALVEPDVRHRDTEPGHQTRDGGHVLEPPEDAT